MAFRIRMTVPQYFSKFIDNKVNLEITNKVCCPFHNENTPSFSYNPSTGKWRCFGACKTGGGVIEMHRMNYKLNSNKEAEKSLCNLLGVPYEVNTSLDMNIEAFTLNDDNIELDKIYSKCLLNCNSIERQIELDYVMSIFPVDVIRLKSLLRKWRIDYDS